MTRTDRGSHQVSAPIRLDFDPVEKPQTKLFYRGCVVASPIQPDSDPVEKPQIKLFYRGCAYTYMPRPKLVAQQDWSTVTLFYRGVTYKRKLQPLNSDRKPRAINWRWNCD